MRRFVAKLLSVPNFPIGRCEEEMGKRLAPLALLTLVPSGLFVVVQSPGRALLEVLVQ